MENNFFDGVGKVIGSIMVFIVLVFTHIGKRGADIVRHGTQLGVHGTQLGVHGAQLGRHGAEIGRHGAEFGRHGTQLGVHGAEFGRHGTQLGVHGTQLRIPGAGTGSSVAGIGKYGPETGPFITNTADDLSCRYSASIIRNVYVSHQKNSQNTECQPELPYMQSYYPQRTENQPFYLSATPDYLRCPIQSKEIEVFSLTHAEVSDADVTGMNPKLPGQLSIKESVANTSEIKISLETLTNNRLTIDGIPDPNSLTSANLGTTGAAGGGPTLAGSPSGPAGGGRLGSFISRRPLAGPERPEATGGGPTPRLGADATEEAAGASYGPEPDPSRDFGSYVNNYPE